MLQQEERKGRSLDVLTAGMAGELQAVEVKSQSLPASGWLALEALQSYKTADPTTPKSQTMPKSPFEVGAATSLYGMSK